MPFASASRQPGRTVSWAPSGLLSECTVLWSGGNPYSRSTPYGSGYSISPGPGGQALVTTSSGPMGALLGRSTQIVQPNKGCTVFLVLRHQDTTNRASAAFGYHQSISERLLCHLPWSDGTIYFDFANSGTSRLSLPGYTKSTSELSIFVFTAGPAYGRQGYRNGVWLGSTTNGATIATVTDNDFVVGTFGGVGPGNSDNNEFYLFGVLAREWAPREAYKWMANPWQVLATPSLGGYAEAGGGGGGGTGARSFFIV